MTEPIDPNNGWPTVEPIPYQPPPPFAPPSAVPPSPVPPSAVGASSFGPAPCAPPASWPAAAEPTLPPPARSRVGLLVGVLVAVLAAAGVLVFVAVHGSDSGSGSSQQLSLPDSFDGYTRLTGQQGAQFESSMKSFASGVAGTGALDVATIRGYTHELGEQPALMVFVFPTPSLPSGAPAANGGLAASMRALVGPSMRDYPTGPHGGELLCGRFRIGVMGDPMCVWSDPDVTGVMMSIESITPVRLSEVEHDLRGLVH